MLLKTILNKLEKYSSIVFKDARFCIHYDDWTFGDEVIVVKVEPRSNGKPICSGCGRRGRCYDHLERRLFEQERATAHPRSGKSSLPDFERTVRRQKRFRGGPIY